jgi:hypothetical protein
MEASERQEEKHAANPLSSVPTVGVFAPARYTLVKITCSYSEVVLRTIKNYKAHYSLSWFMPLLRGNSPTSSIFCIEEEEQCYNGVS